ncbi:hypothetical protein R3P38DRAFT_2771952 [Favolaschia claudopus]|uniref:Uncharacterized protein n=1 Tax=Favolaschia claudopus TaxID=2862362 RepID=A0AAW0C8C0_9AGAR
MFPAKEEKGGKAGKHKGFKRETARDNIAGMKARARGIKGGDGENEYGPCAFHGGGFGKRKLSGLLQTGGQHYAWYDQHIRRREAPLQHRRCAESQVCRRKETPRKRRNIEISAAEDQRNCMATAWDVSLRKLEGGIDTRGDGHKWKDKGWGSMCREKGIHEMCRE